MIDLQAMHHVGIPVADIAAAQAALSVAFGVTWASVRVFDPLPFWTPEEGRYDALVRATYSRGGGQRLELVQGTGAFFDPDRVPDARHIGIWSADLADDAERLRSLDWRIIGCNMPPDEGYGAVAYLAPPMGGLLVELISAAIADDIREWIGD